MKKYTGAKILANSLILGAGGNAEDIYEMILHVPQVTDRAKPGQFINVFTGRGEYILPRPISISEIDKQAGTLTLVYQVTGKGTGVFGRMAPGAAVQILGPLGNGFELPEDESCHVLVGGGIGVPPMLELAKNLRGKITVVIGARSTPILAEKFQALGAQVHIATDVGSFGFHGNVVQLLEELQPQADYIYACGPKIMLKNLSQWALARGINPQVSMEERMACGIGACVGCTVKIKQGSDWQHLKVCKDGPVFRGEDVIWDA